MTFVQEGNDAKLHHQTKASAKASILHVNRALKETAIVCVCVCECVFMCGERCLKKFVYQLRAVTYLYRTSRDEALASSVQRGDNKW